MPRRPSIAKLALKSAGALLGAEVVAAGVAQVISNVRTRKRPQAGFPHPQLPPVQLGDDRLQIFPFGRDLFEAMLAAIDAARETIYLETFIWKGDEVGQRFKDHLARKAAEGVAVYVIYDDFGNIVVPPSFKRFPEAMHVLPYRPLQKPWQAIDPRRYALEHRKILAVDGRTAFIGGYNIGQSYAEHWRDTHLRIEGPAAADFADQFASFWNEHAPPDDCIRRRYPRCFNPAIQIESNNAMQLTFPIRDMYLRAMATAEHSIRLTTAYFVPDEALLGGIVAAAERGVDVQLVLPWVSNHVVTDYLARSHFERLLDAGVRVFAYNSMLHAKTCTIDGQWTTIGTANLDRLSSIGNYELNVEIYCPELARQMEEVFACDVTDAREIDRRRWQQRSTVERATEAFFSPIRALT